MNEAHKQDLMGTFEVAQEAGVTVQAVSNWVNRRADFPKPIAVLRSGPVWDGRVIKAWLRNIGVTTGKRTEGSMSQFVKGEEYTLDEIRKVLGGETMSYLPQVGGRIVCGRFTSNMNPWAPREVLVGTPPNVERKARLLAQQRGVLPIFMKEGPNRWRFHGRMEVVKYDTDAAVVEPRARAAGREGEVVGVLFLRDCA